MARSLNRVQLIGNLTRDPELRYTPSGTAVCSFGLATNRSWTTDTGEKREETEFHRIVAWNKLAELCSQYLTKGKKVYVEGRLSTRSWTTPEGQQRQATEIVIDDVLFLDGGRRTDEGVQQEAPKTEDSSFAKASEDKEEKPETKSSKKAEKEEKEEKTEPETSSSSSEDVAPDDIPF